ncbi:MAG: MBL fold metallo-hydrolase [Desulfobacterota bacterium]|nr:MBL fold metallo-hydrolase [Thermodesulfobacteriota bacterium]MDW8002224.1 MBL fold metallo-hydrolase [Deltaproteobacteria bacterium]
MADGFIKFLGTGGARFVLSKQLRATAGLWLNYKNTNVYIDPGPGAIVKIRASKKNLEPEQLDGLILTHRHLDHSSDANVLIEAMTEGGFRKRGVLLCPKDAIIGEPVIFSSFSKKLERVEIMEEGKTYRIADIVLTTPVRHIHPVETYGLLFDLGVKIGLVSDTKYFEDLPQYYSCDVLIVNVLRLKPIEKNEEIDHLSVEDFKRLIEKIRPKTAIMTHFGMSLIRQKPHTIAEEVKRATGIEVIAAYDGMEFEF